MDGGRPQELFDKALDMSLRGDEKLALRREYAKAAICLAASACRALGRLSVSVPIEEARALLTYASLNALFGAFSLTERCMAAQAFALLRIPIECVPLLKEMEVRHKKGDDRLIEKWKKGDWGAIKPARIRVARGLDSKRFKAVYGFLSGVEHGAYKAMAALTYDTGEKVIMPMFIGDPGTDYLASFSSMAYGQIACSGLDLGGLVYFDCLGEKEFKAFADMEATLKKEGII